MSSHIRKFVGSDGEIIELGFNHDQDFDTSKEIFLCVAENEYMHVGVLSAAISVEEARTLRDHLNFLLGES